MELPSLVSAPPGTKSGDLIARPASPARGREATLRVGMDVSMAGFHSGLRRYAVNLARALAGLGEEEVRLTLFLNSPRGEVPAGLPVGEPGVELALSRVPRRLPLGLRRWGEDRIVRPLQLRGRPVDVYHSLYLFQPGVGRAARVLTVHDLVPLVRPDLVPEAYRRWFERLLQGAPAWAGRILVYSESTRRDLLAAVPLDESRVDCVPLGVGEEFRAAVPPGRIEAFRRRQGLTERYFCCLGDFQPRKNFPLLVEAYRRAGEGRPSFPRLALAGHPGPSLGEVREQIARHGLEDRVTILEDPADEDLPALLTGAEAFLFPSLYEGFGLPPLEAMACGTPVVTSGVSSLPEVVGDAGLSIDPRSAEELAGALVRIAGEEGLRRELSRRGRERAAAFTWARTARGTLDCYRRALDAV